MAKFNVLAKLEARFRTVFAQMNSLQYDACPSPDAYRPTSPETVDMAAHEMRLHAATLYEILLDIEREAEEFIEARDNTLEPPAQDETDDCMKNIL